MEEGLSLAQLSSESASAAFAWEGLLGRPGEWTAMREIAFVVLDLLLVAAKLMLDLVNTQIHRGFGCRT